MSSEENQVHFKVGKFEYYSSIDVVMNFPDSKLQQFCKTHIYWSPDRRIEMREVTIDRDGRHFGAILKHLRGQALKLRNWTDPELEKLRLEADYYKLTSLVHDCVDEQSRRGREKQAEAKQLKKLEEQKKKVEPKSKRKVATTTIEMEVKVKKKNKPSKLKSSQKADLVLKPMAEKNTQTNDFEGTRESIMPLTYRQNHSDLFFNIRPALDLIKASGKLGVVADFEVLDLLDDVNNICQLCHPIKVYLARLPTLIILYDSNLKKLMVSDSGEEEIVVTKESQMSALRNFLDNLKTKYINKLYL